ncbi:RnfABCDGE type electron transport complex subunit B, partial [Xanthomonas sp. Kuri4-1]
MPDPASLTERLDRLLPQTQCGQCGFDGCRPYAEAMARGEAGVERCPPGGDAARAVVAHVFAQGLAAILVVLEVVEDQALAGA